MTDDKKRLIKEEFFDICAGCAFPMIIQIVFSASIILFASYTEELWVGLVSLILGEGLLVAAYFAFGSKNGSTAYTNTVLASEIRETADADYKKGGEYAPYKGFIIGFITTIPYLIFHIFYCIFPEAQFLEFFLQYAFAWAVYPITIATETISPFSMLLVIPLSAIHGAGYIFGKKKEYKRRETLRLADEALAAEFEQREIEKQQRAERQREEARRENAKKHKK